MAPVARGRGRPKKTETPSASNASTPAISRRSSTRVSVILPPSKNGSAPSTVVDDDEDSIFDLLSSKKVNGKQPGSRQSISSLTSFNDPESDYSTPATSAAHTPALDAEPSTTRRGRQPAVTSTHPTPTVDAVKRAALIRNSRMSSSAVSKRKRTIQDDEDDEDAIDLQQAADAQLAQAMQDEEDAAAASIQSPTFDLSIRRTPRKLQKILPKSDYASDFDDEDLDIQPSSSRLSRSSKKVKIELGASGSNSVKFESKRSRYEISDSEDGLDLSDVEIEDSDAEDSDFDVSDEPLTTITKRSRTQVTTSTLKTPAPNQPVNNGRKTTIKSVVPAIKQESSRDTVLPIIDTEDESQFSFLSSFSEDDSLDDDELDDIVSPHFPQASVTGSTNATASRRRERPRRIPGENRLDRRARMERERLEKHHPELHTMWAELENLPKLGGTKIEQPAHINRELKPFQLEGVAWMREMEETAWGGGLLGDEMGMGKTIQAVTLIMSDFPNPRPTLVLIPPVALMQWQQEISDYTSGQLKTFVFHGTNSKTKNMTIKDLKKYNVILMSYNSLESMYRKQEKGFKRKDGIYKEQSVIHQIQFHRVILDEAHNIKQRTSGSAKACFALKADHKWCLSGTPLQNRIGEFFSLVRFLNIQPFACYFCKQCNCQTLNWEMNDDNRCKCCNHSGMQHVSVFNQELLNPIQKYGNKGPGKEAFRKLRILTDRFMLRRVKRDHSSAMELPAKEIYVDRQFFGEEENDFASSIMNNSNRKFETYVAQGVMLNNYANIFGLIMQMRQVADHPDLILKKNSDGGQNILVCCICDDTAEEAIRSTCKHDFCRECVKNYLKSADSPGCPQCHIPLSIDLEQPEIEQDEQQVKKSSIINRIKMENWTSSSKIEALVHDLYQLRSKNMSSKSIIFSQFTTMLQLVEWRLRRAGITTVMLDGSMTPAQRQASINKFMTDVNVECFLVSLKAGGVALNLTEASKVFIVDPWWNPAAEWQSADRCHRIGQARPCSITRLCIEDSVESRMVLLQEKKANMINSTINADESAMESLTPEDMQFLFRGS